MWQSMVSTHARHGGPKALAHNSQDPSSRPMGRLATDGTATALPPPSTLDRPRPRDGRSSTPSRSFAGPAARGTRCPKGVPPLPSVQNPCDAWRDDGTRERRPAARIAPVFSPAAMGWCRPRRSRGGWHTLPDHRCDTDRVTWKATSITPAPRDRWDQQWTGQRRSSHELSPASSLQG